MSAIAAAEAPARPLVRRDPAAGIIGGVCAGLARRLGMDPLGLRVIFILGTVVGGLGALPYGIAWAILPAEIGAPVRSRRATAQVAGGMGLLVLAVLLSLRELGVLFSDAVVWPLVLVTAGGALLWRPRRPAAAAGAPGSTAPAGAPAGLYRGGFGIALVIGAALLFLQYAGALGGLRDVVLGFVVVGISLGLILAPFLWRLGRSLAAERAERIRSQERAELAAHLHDSVLQTLALVRKRAHDPRAVAQLARRQERELRSWLWEPATPAPGASVAASLKAAAVEVEDAHGVAVEVVTVGDAPLDDGAAALVAAAREALTNAAKFAGKAGPVALYAEFEPHRLQTFVRDRGPGFSVEEVPDDRRGVRESIVGRMARHGGRATIGPAPGGGTEVELCLEREVPA